MSRWVAALRLTGIGFFIAVCIAGGTFAGFKLSAGKPVFMIVGLLVGLIVAAFGVYQLIRPLMDDKNDKENS
ncbi:hypothetical protein ACFLX3_05120 [Chloroflexota bacterium]